MESALAAISGDVHKLEVWPSLPEPVIRHQPSAPRPAESAVSSRDTQPRQSATQLPMPVNTSVGASMGFPSSSTVASVKSADRSVNTRANSTTDRALASIQIVHANRFGALSTDDIDDDDDEYQEPSAVIRRRAKRARRLTSPPQQASQQQQQQTDYSRRRTATVFGKSSASTKITAARKIYKKAIFCIDNVNNSCSVKDLCSFVTGLSIEVISCFEAKPRRRRSESVTARKAFRLCIKEEDCAKLFDPTVWPDSVTVSEWFFKAGGRQPTDSTDVNARLPNDDIRVVAASAIAGGSTSSTDTAVAAVAAAAAAAEASTDNDTTADMTLSDDTIVAAYDINNINYGS